jgi:hypothetical protein
MKGFFRLVADKASLFWRYAKVPVVVLVIIAVFGLQALAAYTAYNVFVVGGVRGIAETDGVDGEQGIAGEDGLTPYIGSNNNWWIGDTDTGVSANGQPQSESTGYYFVEDDYILSEFYSVGCLNFSFLFDGSFSEDFFIGYEFGFVFILDIYILNINDYRFSFSFSDRSLGDYVSPLGISDVYFSGFQDVFVSDGTLLLLELSSVYCDFVLSFGGYNMSFCFDLYSLNDSVRLVGGSDYYVDVEEVYVVRL